MEYQISSSLSVGTILKGRKYSYKICDVLGQGAFGITYLATVSLTGFLGSIDSDVKVAVKEFFMKGYCGRDASSVTCSNQDGLFAYYKEKFIHEAENIGQLHHPNIINVIESFEENNTAYYVMEFLGGGSLDDKIKNAAYLSEFDSITYLRQICNALEYMHSMNMLHLDLKPNNIMLHEDGHAVLIDFGLSKLFNENGEPETSTNIGLGTPGYAPIEQANFKGYHQGSLPVTLDIYALGATMYKMLTGQKPPDASYILNEGFPQDTLSATGCSDILLNIVKKCMSPLKKERYQTVSDLIAAIPDMCDVTERLQSSENMFNKGASEFSQTEENSAIDFSCAGRNNTKIGKPEIDFSDFEPHWVSIKVWKNDNRGLSYQFLLTDHAFEDDGHTNILDVWYDGALIAHKRIKHGLYPEVMTALYENGFFDTERWEYEQDAVTTPLGKEFGYDVYLRLSNNKMPIKNIIRRIKNAHPNYSHLLLDRITNIINSSSILSSELDKIASLTPLKGCNNHNFPVILKKETTYRIVFSYYPSFGMWNGRNCYTIVLTADDIFVSTCPWPLDKTDPYLETAHKYGAFIHDKFDSNSFNSIAEIIQTLKISLGSTWLQSGVDLSEDPDEFSIHLFEFGSAYSSLFSYKIGGEQWGTLELDPLSLHKLLTNAIPSLDNLIAKANEKWDATQKELGI